MVSIIIPTYNSERLIIETLQSISAQTHNLWECILVDDGSTDNTIKVVENYIKEDSRFSIYKRPEDLPKGANACRNYGFKISKGEFLQFFDSDDIMLPNCIEGRLTVLKTESLDFVAFAISDMVGDKIIENPDLYITTSREEALETFIESDIIPWNLQRTLFKKAFLNTGDLFNTQLQRFQDIEFNVRLLISKNPTFKMMPIVDCYYRTAGRVNPRQDSFYNDVFMSVPEYFRSITSNISKEALNKNKTNLQKWFYHIVALYTRKKVDNNLFSQAIKSGKQYIGLSVKQSIILRVLYVIKRNPKFFVSKFRLLKFLKRIY